MLSILLVLGAFPIALSQFVPSPGNFPATGDDTIAGGIFSISLTDLVTYESAYPPTYTGTESPKTAGPATTGSGAYPAQMLTDSSLPSHTIYAPKAPPANISLPFLAWANGACMTQGNQYRNLLTEIASHGYVIAADGPPAGTNAQSKVQDSRDSVNWALTGGASKYGQINKTAIASIGHSCGGLEAMSVAYHNENVTHIIALDISIFQDNRRYLLQELKVPVAWFVGGPKDMGYPTSAKDYALLPSGLPAYRASLDTGHQNTYIATNGGKFGKAVVEYLEWQFRGNATSKAILTDPKSAGSLASDNWQNITFKNWS